MKNVRHASQSLTRPSCIFTLLPLVALGLSSASCSVYEPSLLDGREDAPLGSSGAGAAGSTGDSSAGSSSGGVGQAGASLGGEGGDVASAGAAEVASGGESGSGVIAAGGAFAGAGAASGGMSGRGGAGGTSGSAGGGGVSAAGANAGGAGSAGGLAGSGGASAGSGGVGGSGPVIVELAHGKKATASTFQTGNEVAHGNDGDTTTKWCAVDGTFPQWWQVDLGASHSLQAFSVTFEHPDRLYSYKIETSPNGSLYTLQATLNGTGSTQSTQFPANVSARYVRITITDGAPGTYGGVTYPTWACFFEFSVTGY